MTKSLLSLGLTVLCVSLAASASAQSNSTPSSDPRPAFTTADGDTGLWYVPTAEVLSRGKWSASGYRTGFNYPQGFSNVADFPLTFGVGVGGSVEAFASFKAVTRIDRDIRPLFGSDVNVGGPVPRAPLDNQYWTGNKVGDLLVGIKIGLLSESRNKSVALALRGMVKVPTGDKDGGVSTGKVDSFLDVILSKEIARSAEITGYGGGAFRGSPDEVSQSNSFRWGFGAGFPSRSPVRVTAEINGDKPFDDITTVSSPIVGIDGSRALGDYRLKQWGVATLGITFQLPNGFFAGAAMSKSLSSRSRDGFGADSDPTADYTDYQFRIGFHPGVNRPAREAVPPPAPAAPAVAATPPAPPPNRPPTLGAPGQNNGITADSTTVAPGQTITLTANANDADGDTLTYRWTAPYGTFSNPTGRTTQWTAPTDFEGVVPITVTVDDGKGGTTSQTMNVQVVRPAPAPIVQLNFEDVYFDFDRSSLRPEALRLLDDAVAKLQANPTRNMIIEGHTCNIGTAEYNLALGDRRARSVMNYLISRGVATNRLETRSYGEEQPKFDNAREETRRLNRRAALVIKVE